MGSFVLTLDIARRVQDVFSQSGGWCAVHGGGGLEGREHGGGSHGGVRGDGEGGAGVVIQPGEDLGLAVVPLDPHSAQ